ncbi:MAG: hypothetical protein IJX67_05470 [Oscillospiraceae bacterium]|nr:hypothetical protein [Clostridia bacterium]MBQ8617194.1 hypothetical protein [Clostridia bacterium]MBQ9167843.1 hypothetical protein [Oscillospiraceae bacterium]
MATRNPGFDLSRECIRDTLQSKRDGSYKQSGLCFALYNTNIRTLRSTQLAPYSEVMRAGRYMQTLLMKRTAPDIVVVIRGGLVQEVRSTNPYTSVMIADYDSDCDDHLAELEEAEERAAETDMHIVY